MPRDAIITIKKAEAEAHAIEADAVLLAQEMTEETERSCIQFCEKEKQELESELAAQLENLKKKSEALLQRSAQADAERSEEIKEKTKARMRGAVNIVLREIEKQCQGK